MAISINPQTRLLTEGNLSGVDVVHVYCDESTPITHRVLDANILLANWMKIVLVGKTQEAIDRLSVIFTGAAGSRASSQSIGCGTV